MIIKKKYFSSSKKVLFKFKKLFLIFQKIKMETFQYVSDLHIDRNKNLKIKLNPKNVDKNLIIAGDLCKTEDDKLYTKFISKVCKIFDNVFLIPGNHEYYESSFKKTNDFLKRLNKTYINLHVLNKKKFKTKKGNILLGCTLWSYVPSHLLKKVTIVEPIMNFSNEKRNSLFEDHHRWLLKNINKNPNAIVITHHSPSHKFISPIFKKCSSRYRYVNDLDFLIPFTKKWIFGHTHFKKSNGIAISNPMGNPSENIDFDFERMISV